MLDLNEYFSLDVFCTLLFLNSYHWSSFASDIRFKFCWNGLQSLPALPILCLVLPHVAFSALDNTLPKCLSVRNYWFFVFFLRESKSNGKYWRSRTGKIRNFILILLECNENKFNWNTVMIHASACWSANVTQTFCCIEYYIQPSIQQAIEQNLIGFPCDAVHCEEVKPTTARYYER